MPGNSKIGFLHWEDDFGHDRHAWLLQAWLPESPRWLLLSGASREHAEGAVRRAWGSSGSDRQAVQQEVSNMLRDSPTSAPGSSSSSPSSVQHQVHLLACEHLA